MSRTFSCIVVHSMSDGIAKLSQNHYRLHRDDDNEEYRSDEEVRSCEIGIRPDETRKSLFNRLNKESTYIINMAGKLEKTDKIKSVTNVYDDVLMD